MYLMKLRYSNHFGQRAGMCWRLIFVHALMPWLHRYRIQARHDAEGLSLRQQKLQEVRKQFPSLHFVSLHNINTASSWDEEVDDEIQPPSPNEKLMEATQDEHTTKRIHELEQEVRRLRDILAEKDIKLSISV